MRPNLMLRYGLLVLLAVSSVGPFGWLVATALKGAGENIFAYPPQLWPQQPSLEAFTTAWHKVPFGLYFLNSLAVAAIAVVLNLVLSTLAAYPLARMTFKGQKAVFTLILLTLMIPFQAMLIPLYLMTLHLGLGEGGNVWALWLGLAIPVGVSGFGMFFMRQAMIPLPKALEESAVLDGANSLQVLWHVLVPLVRPSLVTLGILTLLASWGDFLWPSLLTANPQHFTLPVGLVELQGAFSTNWRLIAAGTVLSMLPVLVFFVVLQRYFIGTDLASGVKG
jgi:putative chitobiose transport system permease protein